jgi:hypothetical protein
VTACIDKQGLSIASAPPIDRGEGRGDELYAASIPTMPKTGRSEARNLGVRPII